VTRDWFCNACGRLFTIGAFFALWGGHNPVRCPTCKSVKHVTRVTDVSITEVKP